MGRFLFSCFLFSFCLLFFRAPEGAADKCLEGNNITTTEFRQVSSFSEIDISGVFDVSIQYRKQNKVTVTADKNLLPHIITRITEGKLHIFADRSICTQSALQVDIETNDAGKIQSSGATDISVSGVKRDRLEINMNGTGDIALSGKVNLFVVKLSGAADVEAEDLKAETVQISLSGAGDASIYASQKLDATVSGTGTVNYSGNPKKVIKKITGAGELIKE